MMNNQIERAKLLGMDVEIVGDVIEVEGVHLQGTYRNTDQGLAALEEDLNKVVSLLMQDEK